MDIKPHHSSNPHLHEHGHNHTTKMSKEQADAIASSTLAVAKAHESEKLRKHKLGKLMIIFFAIIIAATVAFLVFALRATP